MVWTTVALEPDRRRLLKSSTPYLPYGGREKEVLANSIVVYALSINVHPPADATNKSQRTELPHDEWWSIPGVMCLVGDFRLAFSLSAR